MIDWATEIVESIGLWGVAFLVALESVVPPIPSEIVAYDNWVMLGATALLIGACVTQWRITRTEGAVMLGLYVAYIASLAI